MRKVGFRVGSGMLVVASVFFVNIQSASAIKQFQDEFLAKYVKADSSDANEKSLAEAAARVKCNVCHVGKQKKDRNAYGMALSEILDKKEDKDNKAKIQMALDTVAAMKSNKDEASSPTFGELIKQGKLPGGEE